MDCVLMIVRSKPNCAATLRTTSMKTSTSSSSDNLRNPAPLVCLHNQANVVVWVEVVPERPAKELLHCIEGKVKRLCI
eukprot:866940-Amphidinium_carterae.1